MKQAELLKISKCFSCKKGVMHTGLPLFWRVKVARYGIDTSAVKRQAGLEMMLGNPGLAMVMGQDEDLAKPVMDAVEMTLCESCMSESHFALQVDVEKFQKEQQGDALAGQSGEGK